MIRTEDRPHMGVYPDRAAARAAGHRPADRRDLGYARAVCKSCGSDWPCSTWAQSAEAEFADRRKGKT